MRGNTVTALSNLTGWLRASGWRGALRLGAPRPFAGLALAAGAGILLGEIGERWFGHGPANTWQSGPWIACAGFFSLALLFAHSLRSSLCWALVIVGFATLHLFRLNDPASTGLANRLAAVPASSADDSEDTPASDARASDAETIRVRGVILDAPRASTPTGGSVGAAGGSNWRFTFALKDIEARERTWKCHARVRVFWRNGPTDLAAGDRLDIAGTAGSIAGPRNPGEFDMAEFLRRRDVRTELRCSGITDVRRQPPPHRWLARPIPVLAQRFQAWTQRRLTLDLEDDPEAAAVVSTLLLGLRSEPGLGELEPPFQRTGTLHFFAVDGLKLGLFSMLVVWFLSLVGLRRQWAVTLVLPLLVFYALSTGFGPASLRAVIVAAVFAGGEWIDRPARALEQPGRRRDADPRDGHQPALRPRLSTHFSGGAFHPAARRAVAPGTRTVGAPDPFLPPELFPAPLLVFEWTRRRLVELACVSCAASLGSLPLMLIYFHVSRRCPCWRTSRCFRWLWDHQPGGDVAGRSMAATNLGCLDRQCQLAPRATAAGGGALFRSVAWRQLLRGAAGMAMGAPGGGNHGPRSRARRPEHLRARTERWRLARGQRPRLRLSADRSALPPFLWPRRARRPDPDPGGQFPPGRGSARGRRPRAGARFRRRHHRPFTVPARIHQGARRKELPLVHWRRGDTLPLLGEAEMRVLYPPEHPGGRTASDKALVMQLQVAGWRVLFLGDGGPVLQQWLTQQDSAETLRSDVLGDGDVGGRSERVSRFFERGRAAAGGPGITEAGRRCAVRIVGGAAAHVVCPTRGRDHAPDLSEEGGSGWLRGPCGGEYHALKIAGADPILQASMRMGGVSDAL